MISKNIQVAREKKDLSALYAKSIDFLPPNPKNSVYLRTEKPCMARGKQKMGANGFTCLHGEGANRKWAPIGLYVLAWPGARKMASPKTAERAFFTRSGFMRPPAEAT